MCVQNNILGIFKFSANCSIKNTLVSISENYVANVARTMIELGNRAVVRASSEQRINLTALQVHCRTFRVEQTINNSYSIKNELDADDAEEIRNVMKTELERSMEQDLQNTQQAFSDLPTQQSNDVYIRNIITQIFEQHLTYQVMNEAIASINTFQDMNLIIGLLEGDFCEFTQNTMVEMALMQMMNVVMDRIVESDQSQFIFETIAQRIKSLTSGPIEAFGNKKSSKKTPLVLGMVALAIIALIGGIIALIIRSSSRSTSSSEETPTPVESAPIVNSDSTSVLDRLLVETRTAST